MKWQTQDYMRNCPMTVKEQIKYNFSLPRWKFLRLLGVAGFLTTEPGCVARLRDFTPFYWRNFRSQIRKLHNENSTLRVLAQDARMSYERGLRDGHEIALEQILNQIEGKPINDGII